MLSTLAVGLAAGVGLWMLAAFATVFVRRCCGSSNRSSPKRCSFVLKIKVKDPSAIKPEVEKLLSRYRLKFELRGESAEELTFELRVPLENKTDKLSERLLKLDPENVSAVEWEEKKEKK